MSRTEASRQVYYSTLVNPTTSRSIPLHSDTFHFFPPTKHYRNHIVCIPPCTPNLSCILEHRISAYMEAPLHSHVFRFNTISLIDKMTSDSHGIFEALSEIGVPFVSNIVDRSPIPCGRAPDLYPLFLLSVSCCTFPYLAPFLVLGLSPFVSLSDYTIPCILK